MRVHHGNVTTHMQEGYLLDLSDMIHFFCSFFKCLFSVYQLNITQLPGLVKMSLGGPIKTEVGKPALTTH